MTTSYVGAARIRARLLSDLAALDAVEPEITTAETAHERARAALIRAQADFDQAATELNDVNARRSALRASSARLRASLRTMATFPADVLAMVFAEAVVDRSTEELNVDWNTAFVAYRVAAVNRHWRRTALASAGCWTYIVLPPVLDLTPAAITIFLEHLDLALSRSSSRLLDVRLLVDWHRTSKAQTSSEFYVEQQLYSHALGQIMLHARRIRTLGVRTGNPSTSWKTTLKEMSRFSPSIFVQIMDLLQCPMPELTALSVRCDHTNLMDDSEFWLGLPERGFPQLLPAAPKLESIWASGAPVLCARPHAVGLPSLRFFKFEMVPDRALYDALLWDTLSVAPRLESLILSSYAGADTALHPEQLPESLPITFLHLEQESYLPTTDIAVPHLRSLALPAWKLSELHIRESMMSTITTLTMEMVTFAHNLDVLRTLRAVEHADLAGDFLEDVDDRAFYERMCDPVDPMWPRLRHLGLRDMHHGSEGCAGLLRLVRARNGADGGSEDRIPRSLKQLAFDCRSVPGWVAAQAKEIMGAECVIMM